MRLLAAFTMVVACASCGYSPAKMTVQIGMSAADVNAQTAMAGLRKLEVGSSDWIGHNGPLDLTLDLNGRKIGVPVSGSNGGLQLATWRGPQGDYPEARIGAIVAVLEPQHLKWESALVLARKMCAQARDAGLTTEAGPHEPNVDRNEMNGVAACTVRDEKQSFDARVVPLGMPPSGKFRVELSVNAYFEP